MELDFLASLSGRTTDNPKREGDTSRVVVKASRTVIEGTGLVVSPCRDFRRTDEVRGDVFEDDFPVDLKEGTFLRLL